MVMTSNEKGSDAQDDRNLTELYFCCCCCELTVMLLMLVMTVVVVMVVRTAMTLLTWRRRL